MCGYRCVGECAYVCFCEGTGLVRVYVNMYICLDMWDTCACLEMSVCVGGSV